jgi:hypothetical protein
MANKYQVHKRAHLRITFSNGAPQSLTLEIALRGGVSKILRLDDPELVAVGSAYTYSFVVGDEHAPAFKFRWWGVDADGVEFVAPDNMSWNERTVLS